MVNFPFSLDDDTTLFLAVNNLRTKLTTAIDASTLTIPVITTSGFPNTGYITILTGDDITLAEAITYEGVTNTTFSGTQRGAAGTTAAAHNSTDNVDLTIVADHHNALKDAVIALEEFIGISGSENFLTVTVSGDITVTGTATFCNDTFFATTAKFQPKDPLPSSLIFEANDSVVQLSSSDTTNTIVGLVTDPLVEDVEYLVMYVACVGQGPDSDGTGTSGRLFFSSASVTANTEYRDGSSPSGGFEEWLDVISVDNQLLGACSGTGQVDDNSNSGAGNVATLQGFTTVSGNGNKKLFFASHETGPVVFAGEGGKAPMGPQTIMALPLSGLKEGVDYHRFVDNNSEDFDFSITNAPAGFGAEANKVMEETLTIPNFKGGDYLILASVEAHIGTGSLNADRGAEAQFSIDGSVISPVNRRHTRSTTVSTAHNFTEVHTLNIDPGDHTILIEGASIDNSFQVADFRRPRFIAIRLDSFDQVVNDATLVPFSKADTGTTSYDEWEELRNDYTPNQPEDYIIITHHFGHAPEASINLKSAIRDDTNGVNYRDQTKYAQDFTSDDTATDDAQPIIMLHKVTATGIETTNWVWLGGFSKNSATPFEGPVKAGTVPIATATQSRMFIWSQTLAPRDIECTNITATGITTPKIVAECGEFNKGLTVSGSPVALSSSAATLQSAYDAGDGFINVTGGKPVVISGTTSDEDFRVVGSGTFTEALTVGTSTVHLNTSTILAPTGTFTESLTISGVPVATVTATGGGSSNIDSINSITSGAITIDGSGGVVVNTVGQTITVDGSGVSGGGSNTTFSGSYFVPDAVPISGSSFDDEFDSNPIERFGVGTGLPINTDKWTKFDPDTTIDDGSTLFGIYEEGLNVVTANASADDTWAGYFQDAPTGEAFWTMTAKISIPSDSLLGDSLRVGIFIGGDDLVDNPTTADFSTVTLRLIDDNEWRISYEEWTDYQTPTVTSIFEHTLDTGIDNVPLWTQLYLRVGFRESDGRIDTRYSFDGLGFKDLRAGYTGYTYTLTKIGFGLSVGTSENTNAKFHFFRVVEGNFLRSAPVSGRRVPLGSTLQNAYDIGSGVIQTVAGKPVTISGIGGQEDFRVVGSGTFTEALTIGEDTTYLNQHSITTASGVFSDTLTISGVPVSTGTGGGTASTLQDAFDNGDGTISTAGGKPLELTGTGELVAVTGTFTEGLTIGNSSTVINNISITTGSGIFDEAFLNGVPISISAGANFLGALVHKTSTQNVNSSNTDPVSWNEVIYDIGGWVDLGTDDTIFTVPSDLGISYIKIGTQLKQDAIADQESVRINVQKNGAADSNVNVQWRTPVTSEAAGIEQVFTPAVPAEAGDEFRITFTNDSGGAIDVIGDTFNNTWFAIEAVQAGGNAQEVIVTSGTFSTRLNIPQYSADPSGAADGDLWINTTTSGIRWRVDSITFEVQGTEV